MEKRITKKDRFNQLLAIAEVSENEDLLSFIEHEIELLEKKNSSGEKKATKTQIENLGYKDIILSTMQPNELYSISDINKFSGLEELSSQRVSAIVSQLKREKVINRTEEKRKAYFSLA